MPNGNLAAPVVGFTNAAGKGAAGLEFGDNQLLAGVPGKETIMQSPAGVALPAVPGDQPGGLESRAPAWSSRSTPSSSTSRNRRWPGPSRSSNSVSGTAVVMDVKTGQILSMANLVATHPTAIGSPTTTTTPAGSGGVVPIGPTDAVDEAPNNLAVTQLYEPGSVFKLVTFSAALQNGLINPNTVFTVPDQIMLGRIPLPRCRAAPDRTAQRHADPGPVVEHRYWADRPGRR